MNATIKGIINPLFFSVVDRFSYFPDKSPSYPALVWDSIRYKSAAAGLPLNQNEKTLASLRNKYKGKRCFIIGNGPSLNLIDLTKLKDEYTFGVNAIYLNYEKMQFHPTFYVVEDFLVAEDRSAEISDYKGPQYKFWGNCLSYTLKNDGKTVNLNMIMDYTEPFKYRFSKNVLREVNVGGTVSFVCMQLAYYLGFDEVYMVGFDHNYAIPKDVSFTPTNTQILSKEDDVNHFSKDYFGKGYRWHDPKVDRMETSYELAKKEFEAAGKKIYNATVGGHLETFERKNYNDLFIK